MKRSFSSPSRALLALVLLLSALLPAPARAQGRSLSFIRDAEIESTLREFVTPIWNAAGIDPKAVHLYIVNDPTLNAFVAGGQNMFIHTGLLLDVDTPLQLIGVMAHESGHIAGGHLIRGTRAMKDASAEAILGTLISVGAGVLAGRPDVGVGAVSGTQELARRGFLAFSRAQESAADQAGMTFLDRAGMSSEGMLEFMDKLKDQELLPADRRVEFVLTHPFSAERVDTIQAHVDRSPLKGKKLPTAWQDKLDRMKAKLSAFLYPTNSVARFARDGSFAGRYGYAIALWQTQRAKEALPILDGLLKQEPNNPYLYETKGQCLFENGRVAEAVPVYARAVELAPDQPLIRVAYAHALMESGAANDKAIDQLEIAARNDRESSFLWHLLATAYGRSGDMGMAAYAQAEEALVRNNPKDAQMFAKRAQDTMKRGSRGWLRADDVRSAAEDLEKAQKDE